MEYRLPASSVSETKYTQFAMSPNPVENILRLSFPNVAQIRLITCMDVQGKQVLQLNGENQEIELDVSSMASGIYTIFVEESSAVYQTQKFYKN